MSTDLFDDCFPNPAVYWPPAGYDTNGKPILGPAQQLCGNTRWEDHVEEYLNQAGQSFTSKAKVYVQVPLEIGGRLWQGLLKSAPANPYNSPIFVFEVRLFQTIQSLDGEDVVMNAVL
jgi:hypothetical protein